jgi:Tol biopolymer transport system component
MLTLRPGQRCEVWVATVNGAAEVVLSTDEVLLEAPNWTSDGGALILNGDGNLWRIDLAAGSLERVPVDGIPGLNKDHVLAPEGRHIFLSANHGHMYRAPLGGGQAERITTDDGSHHFLHGVSPDGQEVAYVEWLYPNTESFTTAPGPHPTRTRAGGRNRVRTAPRNQDRRLVPAHLPRRPPRLLPPVPRWNGRTPRSPAGRRRPCFH